MRSHKGKYIVFEGIDGSGKGTQLRMLLDRLREHCIPFHETREPTSGPIGKMLRETFLSGEYETNEIVRQMLFTTDRMDHFYKKDGVVSKITGGINVISDRSYISGIAYSDCIGWDIYLGLQQWMIEPDLVIFLDIDSEIAMERISQGRESLEIYENLETLKKVRSGYLEVINRLRNDYGRLINNYDASRSIEDVHNDIWKDINSIL